MAAPNIVALSRDLYDWHLVAIDSAGTLWCGLWSTTSTSLPHMNWIKATQTWVTSSGSVNST